MAKKSDNDPKQNTLARIRRTEAYAERVRTLFAATVNEILALNKTMPTLPEGEMFSFDNESLKKQKEVERLLRQLHSVATMAIEKGIRLEWAQANAECDKLVQSCFGKRALETPEFTAWTQRNEAAMAAFISRSERGLNLSQRVWKSCRQLRDEMEVAITVAVGDGTSAASMSRSVRKYLNDPDLMFRRFRYKIGEEIEYDENGNEIGKKIVWGKKWKKKIRKPDGTVGWIDYDKDSYRDEWTGPGYYKSSAQNAMRVARTETNIAYRRADNERWQQMDFVLGQRVSLSRSHPKTDICDKLAGDYPPDFVFDGWHPQCFCYVTPILIDEDEILKMNEAMLNGETYKPRGKRITQYPDNFKQWVRDNEERIIASHDTGTDPYFVRNNFGAVQDILNPKKQLTPLEIAEQRHANRTPEQEEKIRLAWQERKDRIEAEKREAEAERLRIERINKAAQNVLKVAQTRFADFDIDTVALDAAVQSGDTTLINAETRALAKKLSEKQKQVKQTANNVIGVASKYKDIAGADALTSLSDLLKTGNVSAINAQTRALAQQIVTIKQQTKAMSAIIPNAHQWTNTFTVAELQAAHDAVQAKLAQLASLPLDKQIKKLEDEIKYVADPTYLKSHTIYPTWKVSQSAYLQVYAKAKHQKKVNELTGKLNLLKLYLTQHPKATALAALIAQADTYLLADNLPYAEMYIADAQKKKYALERAQARRDAKKKGSLSSDVFEQDGVKYGDGMKTNHTFDDDNFTDARKNSATWCQTISESKRKYSAIAQTFFDTATADENEGEYQYTAGSGHMNRPLRGYEYRWSPSHFKGVGNVDLNLEHSRGAKRIKALTELLDRCYYDFDVWLQRGVDSDGLKGFLRCANLNETTVKALVGRTVIDTAFVSCGSCKGSGFSGHILNIYCPKGTRMLYLEGHSRFDGNGENETLIQRNTHFRITKVEYDGYRYFIDLEVVAQI